MKLARFQIVYKFSNMVQKDDLARDNDEAHRMRLLRRAEGFAQSAAAFAKRVGWSPTQLSNYEIGERRVPRDAALQLLRVTPGFDPVWLWTGEERGLSFDLRRRIEAARHEELAEQSGNKPQSSTGRNAS